MSVQAIDRGQTALGKALQLLDVFVESGEPIPLAEAARRLNLPRQTVHRLTWQLVDEGLLRRDLAKDMFAVGPRLSGLALGTLSATWQPGPVHAVLEDLAGDIRETCNLSVLEGNRLLYIDRVECDWPVRAQFDPGARMPIHATAGGKLLLAYLPSRSRSRLLAALPMPALTERTITNADRMAQEITSIRKLGYALNNEENAEGLVGLAVPIRDGAKRVAAALAVHAPLTRVAHADLPAFASPLRDAADRIEHQLILMKDPSYDQTDTR